MHIHKIKRAYDEHQVDDETCVQHGSIAIWVNNQRMFFWKVAVKKVEKNRTLSTTTLTHLPELGPNLVTALAGLKVDDFSHGVVGGWCFCFVPAEGGKDMLEIEAKICPWGTKSNKQCLIRRRLYRKRDVVHCSFLKKH